MAYDDVGSIIGGLLGGFSGTYFPMQERKEGRKLERERLAQAQAQADILNQMRAEDSQWKNMERAAKLLDLARERAWEENFMGTPSGGGGSPVAPSQTPQAAPQGQGSEWWQSAVPGGRVTSEFGPRTPPMPGASSNHQGMDVAAPAWSKVRAPMGGAFGYGQDPKLGNYVSVDDGQGGNVKMGHLMDFAGVDRSQVNPGDLLGYVGQSGVATGPHVHIGTSRGGQPVNPRQFTPGGGLGTQYAQAGPKTATDASGDPLRRFTSMSPVDAERFILSAPTGRQASLRALWKAANEQKDKNGLTGEAKNFEIMMGRKPSVEEYLNFKRQGSPSTTINVGEKKFSEKLAEKWAEDYAEMFKGAELAQGVVANIDAAKAVMDTGLQTGALEPAKAQVANVAQSLGIDPGKLGLQDASTPQAFQAIAMRNLLSELVMQKGPQTEGDAQRAMKVFVSMGNTPQANQFIMDYARQIAQRKIDMANFVYDAGREKHDGDSYKARKEWQDYIKDKPLQFNTEVLSTSPAQAQAATSQAPPEGATIRDKATGKLLKIVNGQPVPLE